MQSFCTLFIFCIFAILYILVTSVSPINSRCRIKQEAPLPAGRCFAVAKPTPRIHHSPAIAFLRLLALYSSSHPTPQEAPLPAGRCFAVAKLTPHVSAHQPRISYLRLLIANLAPDAFLPSFLNHRFCRATQPSDTSLASYRFLAPPRVVFQLAPNTPGSSAPCRPLLRSGSGKAGAPRQRPSAPHIISSFIDCKSSSRRIFAFIFESPILPRLYYRRTSGVKGDSQEDVCDRIAPLQ